MVNLDVKRWEHFTHCPSNPKKLFELLIDACRVQPQPSVVTCQTRI